MKNISLYAVLVLSLSASSVFSMSPTHPAASNLLAELKATLAKRKAARKLQNRLLQRRSVIVDSDTDTDTSQESLTDFTSAEATPPAAPIQSVTPPARSATSTIPAAPPVPNEPTPNETSTSEYSSSSEEKDAYASDLSDIETVSSYNVKQETYSTGFLGENLSTPTGLITHLLRIKEAKNSIQPCHQHSVSQHLDRALLSLADIVIEQLESKKEAPDFIQRLITLKELKGIIGQLNTLKSLAEYHTLTATHATIERAEQAATQHALNIESTKQSALQDIEAQRAPLNEAWSTKKILARAKRLKSTRVGMPSNTAAMDALTFRVAQMLNLQAQGTHITLQAEDLLRSQELLRVLKAKRFPLNPYSARALFEALMALEAKVDKERTARETEALILEDDIERVLEKLTAYVQEEARQHTLSATIAADTPDACPLSDDRDEN